MHARINVTHVQASLNVKKGGILLGAYVLVIAAYGAIVLTREQD